MSTHVYTFTHKGWFGLCPVYFANLDSAAPMIEPRHWLLTPLMMLTELGFGAMFAIASLVRADFEPQWPLSVTGEMSPPVQREFKERA